MELDATTARLRRALRPLKAKVSALISDLPANSNVDLGLVEEVLHARPVAGLRAGNRFKVKFTYGSQSNVHRSVRNLNPVRIPASSESLRKASHVHDCWRDFLEKSWNSFWLTEGACCCHIELAGNGEHDNKQDGRRASNERRNFVAPNAAPIEELEINLKYSELPTFLIPYPISRDTTLSGTNSLVTPTLKHIPRVPKLSVLAAIQWGSLIKEDDVEDEEKWYNVVPEHLRRFVLIGQSSKLVNSLPPDYYPTLITLSARHALFSISWSLLERYTISQSPTTLEDWRFCFGSAAGMLRLGSWTHLLVSKVISVGWLTDDPLSDGLVQFMNFWWSECHRSEFGNSALSGSGRSTPFNLLDNHASSKSHTSIAQDTKWYYMLFALRLCTLAIKYSLNNIDGHFIYLLLVRLVVYGLTQDMDQLDDTLESQYTRKTRQTLIKEHLSNLAVTALHRRSIRDNDKAHFLVPLLIITPLLDISQNYTVRAGKWMSSTTLTDTLPDLMGISLLPLAETWKSLECFEVATKICIYIIDYQGHDEEAHSMKLECDNALYEGNEEWKYEPIVEEWVKATPYLPKVNRDNSSSDSEESEHDHSPLTRKRRRFVGTLASRKRRFVSAGYNDSDSLIEIKSGYESLTSSSEHEILSGYSEASESDAVSEDQDESETDEAHSTFHTQHKPKQSNSQATQSDIFELDGVVGLSDHVPNGVQDAIIQSNGEEVDDDTSSNTSLQQDDSDFSDTEEFTQELVETRLRDPKVLRTTVKLPRQKVITPEDQLDSVFDAIFSPNMSMVPRMELRTRYSTRSNHNTRQYEGKENSLASKREPLPYTVEDDELDGLI